ncbi:MAG: flagellar filament capping protein FliD [Sphingomonadaceae bacterium]|nr:flagellar filament capping protein FliD [Sphingomonadaceae bacterium]
METTDTTSTAASATRALITSLGAGSGIDMASLARDLATAQFAAKIDRLAARSETLDRQISAASNLKSMMFSLTTSLGERVRIGDLAPQPDVANGAVAQASLSGSSQPQGNYSLEVSALASAQTLAGPAYAAATDPVGAGTLTLRFGTIAGASFTADTEQSGVDIAIASGSTLADVASAINGADAGVTAYIADTTTGSRLVLKGEDGATSGFILEAAEDVGEPGLANLAWQPSTGDPASLKTTAADAAFQIDGLNFTSSGNTLTDIVPGLTLELTGTNVGAPTAITFGNPAEAITQAMQDLTAALNEVASELRIATEPKSGDLARDSGALALKRTFSSLAGTLIMPNTAEDEPRTLSDLGLTTHRDGSFTVDAERLAATLERDPEAAAAMFTNGLHGVYATIDNIFRRTNTISDPGTLAGSIDRYTEQLSKTGEDQAKLVERQEALRTRMVARFAVSERRIGAARSTLAFLENQIAVWNKD